MVQGTGQKGMKLAVVSWNKDALERELKGLGFRIDRKRPDVVFCMGGEGTLLFGEIAYPGVPKVFILHKCRGCRKHPFGGLLTDLRKGRYTITEETKVVGAVRGKGRLVGLNDINIHYKLPCAIGLDVTVNRRAVSRNVLGDGLIVSTPYGSGGYYNSITRKTFSRGLGLAFNNPVQRVASRVVREDAVIKARVVKGEGYMACDCHRKVIPLKKGDVVEVKAHPQKARIIRFRGRPKKIVMGRTRH